MKTPYEIMIGLRYLRSRKKQNFISAISFMSMAGVAIGVMALIVVLSVMTGFETDFRDKIVGANSHILIMPYAPGMEEYPEMIDMIESYDKVKGAMPFIYSQIIISSPYRTSGIVLRGIDPESSQKVIKLEENMVEGTTFSLNRKPEDKSKKLLPGIIIGAELKKMLSVDYLDTVDIVSPTGSMVPWGSSGPNMQKYRVIGVFKSGYYEYDSSLAYISLSAAQKFLGMFDTEVSGIEVSLHDLYDSGEVSEQLREDFAGGYSIRDWREMNKNLFSALKLEKIMMSIILVLIILVAAFNIISSLIMVVMEKGKEIAILKSMGARPLSIMKIFITEGLIVGGLGTLFGLIGGVGICVLLMKYEFIELDATVYYFKTLPVQMVFVDIVVICVVSILITLLATIYPSIKASKLQPVEALRYE